MGTVVMALAAGWRSVVVMVVDFGYALASAKAVSADEPGTAFGTGQREKG